MLQTARILMILGIVLFVLGGLFYLGGRLGLNLGRLPGDIRIERENFTCAFPVMTSILLSVILTIGLNLLVRYLNR